MLNVAHLRSHRLLLLASFNLGSALIDTENFGEARDILGKCMAATQRIRGADDEMTFRARRMYAQSICENEASSRDDLLLAVAIVEKDARRVRQVFGESHPMYETAIKLPALARAVLASHEAQATS